MRKLAAVLCAAGLLLAASQLPASAQLAETAVTLNDTQDTASNSLGLQPYQLLTDYDMFFNPASTLDTGSVYGEVLQGAGQTWGGAAFKMPAGRMGFFANRPLARSIQGFNQAVGTGLDPALGTACIDADGDGDCTGGADTPGPLYTLPEVAADNNFADDVDIVGGGAPATVMTAMAYNQRFDALYALPLGDSAGVGIRFSFLRASDNDPYTGNGVTNPGTIDSSRLAQELQFALGARWKGEGAIEKADAVFDLSKPTLDNIYSAVSGVRRTDLTAKDDSALNFGLGVRGVWGAWEENKIVTTARFNKFNTSSLIALKKDNDTATPAIFDVDRDFKYDNTGNAYSADAILHTQPNESLKVFYGVGIEARDFTRDLTQTDRIAAANNQLDSRPEKSFRVPLNLAFQHQTFKRLVTRFGVAHNLINNRDVDLIDRTTLTVVGTERKTGLGSVGATAVSFGLGIVPMEKAIIDLGILTTPFDLDAGAGTADVIARASLKYSF